MCHINTNNFNLKFMNWNKESISFLDLQIDKYLHNCLATKLYRKETESNTSLHARNGQPASLIRKIPYAQYIRLQRNCTYDLDFKLQAAELWQCLLKWGYIKTLLQKACNKAINKNRTALLYPTRASKTEQQTMKFITRYSAQHQDLRNCLSNHWQNRGNNICEGYFRDCILQDNINR